MEGEPGDQGISFGVQKGECMGVRSPNGVGKISTVSVMIGSVRPPAAGKVYVNGFDLADGARVCAPCSPWHAIRQHQPH